MNISTVFAVLDQTETPVVFGRTEKVANKLLERYLQQGFVKSGRVQEYRCFATLEETEQLAPKKS